MMISLMATLWNTIINGVRTMDGTLRGVIILALLLFTFFFMALSINKGKDHDKKPMKWGYFILAVILFGLAIFFAVVM